MLATERTSRTAVLLLALLAGACSVFAPQTSTAGSARDRRGLVAESATETPRTGAFLAEGEEDDARAPRLAPPQPGAERKMVYTGALTIEVARVESAIERFLEQVDGMGGYLASRADSTLTVRVPAGEFDALIAAVRGYGRVLSESLQAREVTEQHRDLTIRLANARKARERLLALLEKAEKVEDILRIEEHLRRLTEEIERIEGELRFLEDRIAMSTLSVTFQAVAAARPDRSRPSRFWWINQVGAEHVRARF